MAETDNTASWLERWKIGRTGWHEPDGNANLKAHWTLSGRRVLVPLSGGSPDLQWLESRGNDVVGVEASSIGAEAFFVEQGIDYRRSDGEQPVFSALDRNIAIICADYFDVDVDATGGRFDACYDRGALVAVEPTMRDRYLRTTLGLLSPGADYLLIAVEYDQSVADGPPYSLDSGTIASLLPSLERVAAVDDLANCPPKFHEAGLSAFSEVVYSGKVGIR